MSFAAGRSDSSKVVVTLLSDKLNLSKIIRIQNRNYKKKSQSTSSLQFSTVWNVNRKWQVEWSCGSWDMILKKKENLESVQIKLSVCRADRENRSIGVSGKELQEADIRVVVRWTMVKQWCTSKVLPYHYSRGVDRWNDGAVTKLFIWLSRVTIPLHMPHYLFIYIYF